MPRATTLVAAKDKAAPSAKTEATPMMAQYLAIKADHPDALLFYRMGDFFELFFEDAEKAAGALDIALTKRGKHKGEDIAMCGVPVATAETYLSRLIAKGFRVAVCEQTEDPKEAKKRGAKAVVRREVVRVVTPGTITEEGLLDARSSSFLAAVAGKGPDRGLAWADVSTGEFGVTALKAKALGEEVAALAPKELLVADDAGLDDEVDAALERAGGVPTLLPAAKFSTKAGRRRLEALFDVASLDGFGDFSDVEIAAAGALVDYLELTQAGGAPRLRPPVRRASDAGMAIDPATRASLELERTLKGERKGSLLHAVDRTVTGPGARALAARLARPLTDRAAIARRLDAVAFLFENRRLRARLRDELRAAGDPARALSRLLLGRGGPRDLAALSRSLRAGGDVVAAFSGAGEAPRELADALEALTPDARPEAARFAADVAAALVDEPAFHARDGGFIREGVDADLDAARRLRDDSRKVIVGLQKTYAEATGVSGLKVKHNNVLGYFIEVTAKHGDTLLAEPHARTFIHRQTMANAMRFSTEELGRLESEIAAAADKARGLELALFDGFVERARGCAADVRDAADALAVLDVAAGLAEWADEAGAVRPEVDDTKRFEVEAGRHPVVEAALAKAGEPFTPNACALDGDGAEAARLVVVTGPNMAGKSTFLRQNALVAILAQAGSFVPAKAVRIGVVDRVFSRVGAADDLARGRSTFMAEMVETAAILNQAGPRALVILDEIGRGTATYDGLAIAWAVMERLHDVNQSRALFATHYHELTALADRLAAAGNASLRAKEWKGELVFLHEVGPGPADKSYGVEVARRAGLPAATVTRARGLLAKLENVAAGGAAPIDQLNLFASGAAEAPADLAPATHPALEALAEADPDALSPREALDLVYRLKSLAEPS